jgi:hypothetical protein
MTRIICKCISSFVLLLSISGLAGCGSSDMPSSTGPTTLTVTASAGTVLLGKTVQFTATGGTVSSWTVNGVSGGSAATGTIGANGLYTAPTVLPTSATVTIGATSGSLSGTASVTVSSDVAVSVAPSTSSNPILTQSTLSLTGNVTSAGAPSTSLTWMVNGVTNGNSTVGTITPGSNGTVTYTAPALQPGAAVQIVATSVADPSKSATLTRTVQGILLSAATGVPGQPLTLTGHFNTSTPLIISFTDAGSFSAIIPITPDSATTASVILPMYNSTATDIGVQGTVSVAALQQSGTSTVTLGTAPSFSLQALPAATGNPGDVTLAFLKAITGYTAQTQSAWDTLAASSKGTLTVTTTDKAAKDVQTQLRSLIAGVATLSTTPISVGAQGMNTLKLDSTTVVLLDRFLQAYVVNNPAVVAASRAELHSFGIVLDNLSPADQVHAALFGLPSITLPTLIKIVVTGIIAAEVAPVAGLVVGVMFLKQWYDQNQRNNTATEVADKQPVISPFNSMQLLDQAFQNFYSNDSITPTGPIKAIQTDDEAIVTAMNDSNPSSELITTNNLPIIESNEPTPPTTPLPSPVLNLTSSASMNNGGSELDVSFVDLPKTTYSVMPSWDTATLVSTNAFGTGSTTVTVPAPTSGTCYSGTVSLLDPTGAVVASQSGCFASSMPKMDSISGLVAAQSQTVIITGSGFGTHVPYSGSSSFISLQDPTASFGAGYGGDTVGLAVSLWSDTQIVLQGFTGAYGSGTDQYQLSTGDQLVLAIYNPISGDGPSLCSLVVGGGAVVCQ